MTNRRTLRGIGLAVAALAAAGALRRSGKAIGLPGTAEPRLQPLAQGLAQWATAIAREIDTARLRQATEELAVPRGRLHAPEAIAMAEETILRGFRAAGWRAERRPFSYSEAQSPFTFEGREPITYPRLDGANVVAVKPGETMIPALVVCAHFDTVQDGPGADDNAASVAALLELARVLAPFHFRRTIVLAALDMEEIGFFGATALVDELKRKWQVRGAINLDTVAYTSSQPHSQSMPQGLDVLYPGQMRRIRQRDFRGDWTAIIYNGPANRLASSFARGLAHVAGADVPVLVRDPNDLPLIGGLLRRSVPAVRNFSRSDHFAFWQAGIPALIVSDTANFRYPHYHLPTDTPEKLDYERLAGITAAVAVALALEAGLLPASGSQVFAEVR